MRPCIYLCVTSFLFIGLVGCESKKTATKSEPIGMVCNIDDDCHEGEVCVGKRCKKGSRSGGDEGQEQADFSPDSDREKLLLFKGIGKQEYLLRII